MAEKKKKTEETEVEATEPDLGSAREQLAEHGREDGPLGLTWPERVERPHDDDR